MSILHYHGRPWINFDADNREHRKWFNEFQRSGSWGKCPVRFFVSDDHGNLINLIQHRMLDYYMKREFK